MNEKTDNFGKNICKLLNMLPDELSKVISDRSEEYTSIWCNKLITDYDKLFDIIMQELEKSKISWLNIQKRENKIG